ncbi:hypothetical protein BBJ29_000310 [Phytophthora kernoviae]|uniref:Transmembrane protein n=1 Tax=Phytophthora kernoviae TaxID=325452 RepID=A0A3R7K471_9STRA|nr:hypothetical protein BBJ29_000310 [Phytophthora kernoviae]
MVVSLSPTTFQIDSKTKIKDVFKCSSIHSIGSFNEYYVACELHVPNQDSLKLLEIVNVTVDGAALSPLQGVHTELTFQLNTSLATVSLLNAQLKASAVEFHAANVLMDEYSSVNVSGRGLKFGPGYNSWGTGMGGSYGGIGGASLTGLHPHCDDMPPNDFFRPVGDVSANSANFRGAGSGGSILITATERIHGNATVQANGGQPSVYNSRVLSGGGGGGGGGGRIVLDSRNAEELGPSRVEAYGGGYTSDENSAIGWCQLGGDGTILKLQHSTKDEGALGVSDVDEGDHSGGSKTLLGSLLVKGDRLSHAGPVKRIQIYGCTPIYEQTPRVIQLKESVGSVESSIVVDSGSELNVLGRDRMIRLSVSQLTIQGYVGPSSQLERDLFGLTFVGADVSLSNAMVMVHEFDITARGAFSIDKYSELKFRARVRIQTDASVKIEGFLQPLSKPFEILRGLGPDDVPVVSLVSKKDVELRPQTVEMGSVMLYVNASGMGFVDMPFDTPFLRLSISAANVSIANVNSGPVLGCKEIAPQADAATCSKLSGSDPETQPYSVGVFASELATFGNISAGSMILCSGNSMTIEGTISSASLGCGSGVGPGKSEIAGEASGGAGHGGRGGNVLPGSTGGGAAYDTSAELAMQQSVTWADAVASAEKGWPIWPGSGAASGDTPNKIIGGYGGNSNCTVCGIGETTAKVGSTMCVACKIKPTHSEFNMRGNCSYACAKGRNGLDCLTPFERLVKPIGGPIGFVILVFSVTGLIFGSWGFFSYRSSRSELRRYAQYKAQRLRDELSLETLTRTLTPRLTDQDLSAHVARLYLSGDNHLKSGWRLNPYFLPASLRDIVEEGTYANFASTCNKLLEWDPTGWEAWLFRFLMVIMPPAGTLFMRRRQLHRVVHLSKYTIQYGGRFFRDMNFRVHGTQLKVGFSPDFSLGYFDVLISQSASSSSLSLAAMQVDNHGDVILVVGGSGSFFRPYHLDTNDIIVRAIPSRLELLEHNFWIDFVADINRKLRVLPQPSSAVRRVHEAAKVARDILAFVEGFNEKHSALWSVLGILPTAIVGSPLLGLMFVTRKSIFYGKLFTMWNCSSIVNQVVAFVCGLVYLAYIHDNILLVAIGGVLVKYFEKEIALRCIAQYASERPLRGWRGLHTTRDWYDAAYTPLIHYES